MRRKAFTLVELLVVMVIIAILIGLALSGVQRVRQKAKELQVRNDIQQLSAAIQGFQTRYQVSYVPSRIVLKNTLVVWNPQLQTYVSNYNQTPGSAEFESWKYLKRVWPRLTGTIVPKVRGEVRWFPDDVAASANTTYYLEGDQCLVFFLGGIQYQKSCRGFATNVSDPTNWQGWASGQGAMEPPIFSFPSDRLDYCGQGWPGGRDPIGLSYTDPWGSPYVYFSSGSNLDYRYGQLVPAYNGTSDVAGLQAKYGLVFPYQEPTASLTIKWYNGSGFQILCAGKDQQFGPGGQWSAAAGYGPNSPGADDFSNFHPMALGNGTDAQ